MNKRFIALALTLFTFSFVCTCDADILTSSFRKADTTAEKDITAVFETFNKAYSTRDIDGTMALLAKDPDMVFIGSLKDDKYVGSDKIQEAIKKDFESFETLTAAYENINITRTDTVAIGTADFSGTTKTTDGQEKEITGRQTFVFEKRGGKWLIVHSHFSFPETTSNVSAPTGPTEPVASEQAEVTEEIKEIELNIEAAPAIDPNTGDVVQKIQKEATDEKLAGEDA